MDGLVLCVHLGGTFGGSLPLPQWMHVMVAQLL